MMSLKGYLILILFLYFNVVISYNEVKARELMYFNNLFLHFCNK